MEILLLKTIVSSYFPSEGGRRKRHGWELQLFAITKWFTMNFIRDELVDEVTTKVLLRLNFGKTNKVVEPIMRF